MSISALPRSRNFSLALVALLPLLIFSRAAVAQTGQADAPSRFAQLDGNKVHYKSLGKGDEALVFVHGWTCNMDFWKENESAFAGRTRVILIDLPGHGQSDKPQTTYSMDLFARGIEAGLRDAGVKRATLVGHSMGTPVIRQFYRRYPEKTRALVIVDGSLRPFGDKAAVEKLMAPMRGPNYQEFAGRMIDGMVRPVKDEARRAEIKAAMLRTPQHVAVGAFDAMLDPAIWQQDKITVPVLAIHARQPMWTPEYEQFVRDLIPHLDYQVWDGVSHFLMMDEPQKFNDAL